LSRIYDDFRESKKKTKPEESKVAKGASVIVRNWRIPEFFPQLNDKTLQKLRIYFDELIRFNGRINLISARSEENADIIHFADSILASQVILDATNQKEIFDIGTGNGLPGIILAILAPERQILFIDKDARKIEFIKHMLSRLEIKNAQALHKRVEELEHNRVHCAVSRGFASISKSLLLMRKSMSSGAEYYHLKTDAWTKEVAEIPTQICSFWTPSLVGSYELPNVKPSKFTVVLTKKL